jgi:hypothetical protein
MLGPLMVRPAGTNVPVAIAPVGNSLQVLELTPRPPATNWRHVDACRMGYDEAVRPCGMTRRKASP